MSVNLIYCLNLEQLKQELVDNGYFDEEIEDFVHIHTMSKILKNENGESLAVIKNNKLDLSKFPSLTDLGTIEEVLADPDKHEIYKRIYPYHIPIIITNDDGSTYEYYRPKIFCEIG